jgi:zinc/manganese transport system permease protein
MPEYLQNALLAATPIALACGALGWFVVLRGQVFAGDALGHVAFPGALAAAAAGLDARVGLFAATILAAGGIALLGRGAVARAGARGGGARPADDTAIGIAFMFVLGVGVLFLSIFSEGSGSGIEVAHTLFGSVFGLAREEALLAAAIAFAVLVAAGGLGRPLLFASLAPEVAASRGVPTRLLGIAFLVLLGAIAAEATQAVGALLLLGLLAAPAGASHRIARSPAAGVALSAGIALGATWLGLGLAYALPTLPPSSGVVGVAVGAYALSSLRR